MNKYICPQCHAIVERSLAYHDNFHFETPWACMICNKGRGIRVGPILLPLDKAFAMLAPGGVYYAISETTKRAPWKAAKELKEVLDSLL